MDPISLLYSFINTLSKDSSVDSILSEFDIIALDILIAYKGIVLMIKENSSYKDILNKKLIHISLELSLSNCLRNYIQLLYEHPKFGFNTQKEINNTLIKINDIEEKLKILKLKI